MKLASGIQERTNEPFFFSNLPQHGAYNERGDTLWFQSCRVHKVQTISVILSTADKNNNNNKEIDHPRQA